MNQMEMNAPKIRPDKILINVVIEGEPLAWKRASRCGARSFDNPENAKAKEYLVERFEWAYPRFAPIEKRDLGVQMFFQTQFDSKDKDNMEKLVNDAFNGVIWADDRRIKEGYQRVNVWPRKPFTQIVVYLLGGGR
jgi:Holliday junction resolvase RusA-like endonuclease